MKTTPSDRRQIIEALRGLANKLEKSPKIINWSYDAEKGYLKKSDVDGWMVWEPDGTINVDIAVSYKQPQKTPDLQPPPRGKVKGMDEAQIEQLKELIRDTVTEEMRRCPDHGKQDARYAAIRKKWQQGLISNRECAEAMIVLAQEQEDK